MRLEPVLAAGRGARRPPRRDRRRGHGRQRRRRGGARPRARLARDADRARGRRAVQPRPALAGARGRRRRTSGSRCASPDGVDAAARRGGARDRRRAPATSSSPTAASSTTTTWCSPPAPRRGFRPSPACIARACSRSARLADMRAIRAAAAGARRAVVVGGGLLGLEAARGLRERGVAVTVVHLADRLMELQLDPLAARLLERRIRALGIEVLCGQRTEAVTADGRRRWPTAPSSTPTSSSSPPASGPRSRSRATPGSRSAAACWSTTTCGPARPGVWAVGECAEHRGTVYGLWAPVLEQARAAGAAIAGPPERVPRRGAGDDAEGRRHRPLLRGRAPPSPTRSPRR